MMNRSVSTEHENCPSFREQRLVTDLVAELAIVLHEKANLESENATLKLECQELKHKIIYYQRILNEEKIRLIENVKNSQEMICEKEYTLSKKDVQHLQEQKKCLLEVNELKAASCNQKYLFERKNLELIKEIELLKAKTLEANNSCNTHQKMADSFKNKYIKYKAKMKYAIGIINTLTAALETYEQKPIKFSKESQTETRYRIEGCTSSCSLHSQRAVTNENIILTELFFRQHPSNDEVETIFFVPSNKSNENFQEKMFK